VDVFVNPGPPHYYSQRNVLTNTSAGSTSSFCIISLEFTTSKQSWLNKITVLRHLEQLISAQKCVFIYFTDFINESKVPVGSSSRYNGNWKWEFASVYSIIVTRYLYCSWLVLVQPGQLWSVSWMYRSQSMQNGCWQSGHTYTCRMEVQTI